MAVGAIASTHYEFPIRPARETGEARQFSIPKSPLRADSAAAVAERDYAADSVELTREFPALFVNQPYPAPAQQSLPGASLASGGTAVEDGEERRRAPAGEEEEFSPLAETDEAETAGDEGGEEAEVGEATDPQGRPLDEGEQRQLDELETRDREVRTHEQAHKAAGGQYAGAISYEYQQGPDGKRYAVGGEVSIDVSPEKDPAATIAKMRQVRSAALAPAEPSGQDRAVAAQAMQAENEARQELLAEQTESGGAGRTESADAEDGRNGAGQTGGASGNDGASGASNAGAVAPARLSTPAAYESASAFNPRSPSLAASALGYTPIDVFA